MQEEIEKAVEKIFADYEETAELKELKEEIVSNLSDRVSDMTGKGMNEKEALDKALDELGDITEVADTVSRQKRTEIISHAYMRSIPLDKVHLIGYPAAGVIFIFGLIVGAITGFSTDGIMETIASFMPFGVVSLGAFVFLGLTQETRVRYAMSWKRSLWYTLASALLLFGLFVAAIVYFSDMQIASEEAVRAGYPAGNISMVAALGTLIAFVIPGAALLAFLVLSEKDRKKTWVRRLAEEQSQVCAEKFGLLSGAIWIAAFAFFCLFGFLAGWHISWVSFLFAIAAQCVLRYFLLKKENAGQPS
ncbi:permease prefix domain 1-containing protein [Brucepastera parasyntrophica]|uniref:permease prefix domain 1-containing protein n=1 Tax=Brucepastera parasyntrophica TaxID=2880008 RepID=UPI00210DE14A|nr:permease prefix domain 1-containing protein [Brucepastera parasyntrophica]ULQ58489.1 permease prefix domain 1-containing protein [Brucepastera parasyntrophica]